jgi:hypothetical protein
MMDACLPLGIDFTTGDLLATTGGGQAGATATENAAQAAQDLDFGVTFGVEPQDLSSAGWGVIFHAQAPDKLIQAVSRLVEHRRSQASQKDEGLFKTFSKADGYRPGDTAEEWLSRRGVANQRVKPRLGVPFYLLIVGSPSQIPFSFQYGLDVNWGVGRLHFDNLEDYESYADSVIRYETQETVTQRRKLALFSTRHKFDVATQLFADKVSRPFLDLGLGADFGWQIEGHLGPDASKNKLGELLRGGPESPAILFSGSHGMAFPSVDPTAQAANQGALVCNDWKGKGLGNILPEHWFGSDDLVRLGSQLSGLIHFSFACFSAGTPEFDGFDNDQNGRPKRLAGQPFVAPLCSRMLAGGHALAFLGHVDRAWTYSFQTRGGVGQIHGFEDVFSRIMAGQRLGFAVDGLNERWGAMSADVREMEEARTLDPSIPLARLSALRAARDDARNFVLMGDPAVRLRVEDMTA